MTPEISQHIPPREQGTLLGSGGGGGLALAHNSSHLGHSFRLHSLVGISCLLPADAHARRGHRRVFFWLCFSVDLCPFVTGAGFKL